MSGKERGVRANVEGEGQDYRVEVWHVGDIGKREAKGNNYEFDIFDLYL